MKPTWPRCARPCLLLVVALTSSVSRADFGLGLSLESSSVWEARNDVRIPGDRGSRIDLGEGRPQPAALVAPRVYVSYRISDKHRMRALWAPLAVSGALTSGSSLRFADQTFSAGEDIQSYYRFHSYRLTYTYHFSENLGLWDIALGGTLKIRDAEIRLSRAGQVGRKKNWGLVPLLHFEAQRSWNADWNLRLDLDGLAAPQGRAFDLAFFVERYVTVFGAGHVLWAYAGYRMLEGGADNPEVYTFALFHGPVVGLRGAF